MQALEPRDGDLGNPVPDPSAAGEGDHAHVRMAHERLTGDQARAGHDVEHAIGESGGGRVLREHQRRQWREFAGLEDDGVTGRDRRQHLPHRHLQRIVPGRDRTDHANRLAADRGGVGAVPLGSCRALQVAGGAGEELRVVDAAGDVELGGQPDGLAGLRGLHLRVEVGAFGHLAGEVVQGRAALGRCRGRPRWEGGLCCSDRAVNVVGGGQGDSVDDLAGRRVRDVQAVPGTVLGPTIDPLASAHRHTPCHLFRRKLTGLFGDYPMRNAWRKTLAAHRFSGLGLIVQMKFVARGVHSCARCAAADVLCDAVDVRLCDAA